MAAAGALALATPPAWQPTWPAPSLGAGGAGASLLPQAGGARPTPLLSGAAPLFARGAAGDARPSLPGLRPIQTGDAVAFLQAGSLPLQPTTGGKGSGPLDTTDTGGHGGLGPKDLDYSMHDPEDWDLDYSMHDPQDHEYFDDEEYGHGGFHEEYDDEEYDDEEYDEEGHEGHHGEMSGEARRHRTIAPLSSPAVVGLAHAAQPA